MVQVSPRARYENNIKGQEALGTGSSSWHSEDGGPNSRRGRETPSSCATPTSASFPSEPEIDGEVGIGTDGNNPTAPYPCQFCDRTFPRLSYLKKHEQVVPVTSSSSSWFLRPGVLFFSLSTGFLLNDTTTKRKIHKVCKKKQELALAGWLVGWLVGWLTGWLVVQSRVTQADRAMVTKCRTDAVGVRDCSSINGAEIVM
ncbi:hypothetical protein M0802_015921 [Mischocyttarus mexicanus]|nr:hypothetical protein M0802_015921 [Mischocyttarus mexicanus]